MKTMAAYIFDHFPATVRAMAAHCKLSFAIRPGLSQEDRRRPNEMTKERQEGNTLHSHSSSADARKAGVGRNRGSSTSAPSLSVSASLSSSRSLLSRTSHSDASVRPPQPGPEPASLHPWWIGSPAPPCCTCRWQGGPGSETGSSLSPSPSTPPSTAPSAVPSIVRSF